MRSLAVPLAHAPYEIRFDRLDAAASLAPLVGGRACLIVTDTTVAPLYAERLTATLRAAGATAIATTAFAAGEEHKTLATLAGLYSAGVAHGLDRGSVVVALGGGVVGDTAGFFAATYMRGVDYVQVPTTLLAQVDSAVGGKTAIDLPEGKNLVGAFHQPRHVLVDVETLRTLPARQLRCGLAEVVKYGVIMDEAFFGWLESRIVPLLTVDLETYEQVTHRCCELKAQVVVEDEYETTGRRAILNYGHTFGHALETLSHYSSLTHGEAIAIGMGMAVDLALLLAPSPALSALRTRQDALLGALGLPTRAGAYAAAAVAEAMTRDKKYQQGRNRLILPTRLGEVKLVKDTDEALIRQAIEGRCDQ